MITRVGVIVVNFNSGALLTRCLERLAQQTRLPDRVLIVDNASEDNSVVLASGSMPIPWEVLRQAKNIGFAAANNLAVHSMSDCGWTAFLNPDAFPERNWLEALVTAAESHPEVAAFGSRQLCESNSDLLDGIGDSYDTSGLVWRTRHRAKQREGDLIPREIFSPCAAAALYRRGAVMSVGALDENFFCYLEDVDLGFRLRLFGHKCMYVPDAVVHHVGSATTGGQHSDFSVYYGHRNLVWTFVKNMPGVLFWCYLPRHLLLNFVSILWFAWRGQGRVILRAKRDAIRGLPRVWRQRREIQRKRKVGAWEIRRVMEKGLLTPYFRRGV